MQFSSGLKHELCRHWPAGTLEFAYCRTTKPDTSLSCGESSTQLYNTVSTSLLNPRTVCLSLHYPGSAPQTTKSNQRIYHLYKHIQTGFTSPTAERMTWQFLMLSKIFCRGRVSKGHLLVISSRINKENLLDMMVSPAVSPSSPLPPL